MCEGEKVADAATKLLPDRVAVSSPNGSNAAGKADWRVLAGRWCTIWPDADEPGQKYAGDVARALAAVEAATVAIVDPPAGAADGWDAADALEEGWDAKRAATLIKAARLAAEALQPAHVSQGRALADKERNETSKQKKPANNGGGRPPPQRNRLVKIAEGADLWHSPEREPFATVPNEGHHEIWAIRSKDFRCWLAGRYYDETGGAPGGQGMEDALRVLETLALRGLEHRPCLRVAGHEGSVYVDLSDRAWRAVRITSAGWQVIDQAPVKFVRSPAMHPLPEPDGGASIDTLRQFVNVTSDDEYRLVVGFLVGALRPDGPYPILLINGEQGSAKSTLARVLGSLIDPRSALLRALPRDERDLAIATSAS